MAELAFLWKENNGLFNMLQNNNPESKHDGQILIMLSIFIEDKTSYTCYPEHELTSG